MAIYSQSANDKSIKWFDITATAGDLTALEALLEGKVAKFNEVSNGGTTTTYPAKLNTKKLSCGKLTMVNGKQVRVSCSFKIPHVKPSKTSIDIKAVVVGAFDADFVSTAKCEYMNLFYDRN
ncbi:MAG: hypothetical protein WC656_03320 [Sulfurimonas sp.]|jgi:hypothetical protein